MPIKKSELYSSLWKSCDELRGGMDASQYKDYVLVLLFVKYVSDKYAGQKDALIEVPKGASFDAMVKLRGDKEIGDKINKLIAKLAEANDLKGVIDVADFNDADKLGKGKEMVDRLSNLVSIFANPALDFRSNRAEGDDLLGDAYEYLMRHFATESGKSKGQFYTPAEVSRIMAQVIGLGSAKGGTQTIYDPTCGSGSLLLKAYDEARYATGKELTIYGQEKDNATSALAKMNMVLHDCPSAEIWKDNTLSAPHFTEKSGKLKTFDFAVSNPPFSDKAWSNGIDALNDTYGRFELGIPPQKNGDYAFLLHMLASLKSTGKGAIIVPHGVLFRGNVEAQIRRAIVERGYIKGIIGLPANLFYGTGIPACIIVLDKEHAQGRKGIFMVDASKGFQKDGNKNRLRSQDIHKIADTFNKQIEIPRYSRMVPVKEIADDKNAFNLNLPRYIDSAEPEDIQDIEAHLKGGIPNRDIDALQDYWDVFPGVRQSLFDPERKGYSKLKVKPDEINATIFEHEEFSAFQKSVTKLFDKWVKFAQPKLTGIKVGTRPKNLIHELAKELLEIFKNAKLVDPYDVYQHLMDYWSATMQDDVYILAQEGWMAVLDGKPNTELIPETLVIRRYFEKQAATIEKLEGERAEISRELEELDEEHGGEDGLLAAAKTDKGRLTQGSLKVRMAEVNGDSDAAEERALLERVTKQMNETVAIAKAIKAAEKSLSTAAAEKCTSLTKGEIAALVVGNKWVPSTEKAVQAELNRVSQSLAGRTKELAQQYATSLPELERGVHSASSRVQKHLLNMGHQ